MALFAHIVAARRMWLSRLGVIPAAPGALFPDDPDVSRVADAWREVQGLWRDFLAGAADAALGREFEYQSLDVGRFRYTGHMFRDANAVISAAPGILNLLGSSTESQRHGWRS